LQAIDPESTAIVYSLGQAPAGMTINASTGMVEWTPAAGQVGKSIVTLIATDAGGAKAVESFELDVLASNSLPTIASTAPIDVAAGALFTYQVLGRDADLDQLSYELTTALVGATIDPFGKITWPTTPSLIGSHDFVVRVTDPRGGQATQAFTLAVIADTIAPKVSLIESLGEANRNVLPWQGPFVVYARAIDNVAIASLTLTANGRDIPLDAAGTASFTFEEWRFQQINATATAIDTNGNRATKTISFDYDFPEGWNGAGTEDIPTVAITSPTDTAAVFGMVTITGTASHADFAGYKLSYRRIDETTFTQFHESTTAVVNGTLGVWDTSLLINDEYVIRVEAASNAGVVNVIEHSVGLSGELKLGNFQLSFTDIVIPVAGIPIEITRIYDTLQADREGDFGYGWRLEYRNTDLRVGLPKSGLEDIGIYSPLREGVKVYLNVPGLGRQGFTFTPDIRVLPGFGRDNNLILARPKFTPDRGVTSTLSTGTNNYLQVNERGELFAPGGIPYNPASPDFGGEYFVTTREGVTYRIDGTSGELQVATDRVGNLLKFTDEGIQEFDRDNQSSIGVSFQRDAAGRIVQVQGPADSIRYRYDNGVLIASSDALNQETKYVYETNGSNRLVSVIDPLGRNGVRTEYDGDGRTIAIVGAGGERVEVAYNTASLIQTTKDPLGFTSVIGFDQDGNVIFEQDPLENFIRREFDSNSRLKALTDKLGNTTQFLHNSFGDLTSYTDPLGNTVRFEHNRQGDTVATLNALGERSITERDAAGNTTRIEDATGLRTDVKYDSRGNATHFSGVINQNGLRFNAFGSVAEHQDSRGVLHKTEFDPQGRVIRTDSQLKDGRTATTTHEYDAAGKLIKKVDALGGTTQYTYDSVSNLIAVTDALGNTTRYEYDRQGRLTKSIFADATPLTSSDNPYTQIHYDALGRVVETLDELRRSTKFQYDPVGNLLEEIFPDVTIETDSDNPRKSYEYDANGNILAITDELGRKSEYTYDVVGNKVAFRDAAGNLWRTEYSAVGRRELEIDPSGDRIQLSYDSAGRLIGQRLPDSTVARIHIDATNRVVRSIQPDGATTISEFSDESQLIHSVDQDGTKWNFEYNSFGTLEQIENPNGQLTSYRFDLLGRKVGATNRLGDSASMRYDAMNNLVEFVDFNGNSTQYRYDHRYRLIEAVYEDGTRTQFEYDLVGNRTAIVGTSGRTEFRYDERNRLIRQTNPDSTAIDYQYDAVGNRTALITRYVRTDYRFSPLNKIERVLADGAIHAEYQYDQEGNLIRTLLGNGLVENRTYDSIGRLLSVSTSRENVSVSHYQYAYNALGQRVSLTNLDGSSSQYSYDRVGRLVSETLLTPASTVLKQIEYEYDNVGNRISTKVDGVVEALYEYNANDQLTRMIAEGRSTTYEYDKNGNLLSESTNGTPSRRFHFDSRDRMVSVDTDADGTNNVDYRYDEIGNRISKTIGGEVTYFLVDSLRDHAEVVAEYNDTQISSVFYVFGHGILSQVRNGSVHYYHSDAVGSVRMLTDASGTVRNQYQHNAFGELLSSSVTIVNEYLFAGQRRDFETGLDYLRARYMNPEWGRFISQDAFPPQIQRLVSMNGYAYADGNPISFTDPSGFSPVAEQITVQGIVKGLLKSTGTIKSLRAARQRAEIAQQLVFLVSAGIHAAAFYMFDSVYGKNAFGAVGLEIGFEHETSSDLWIKKVKLSFNLLADEREYEFGFGKLGENTDPSFAVKFCGGSLCGAKAALSRVVVQIPEAKGDGVSNEFDGAFLAIALKGEASIGVDAGKSVGDVNFGIEAVAFGTLKYSITLFSAASIARLANG
jgi:large repetitive protein